MRCMNPGRNESAACPARPNGLPASATARSSETRPSRCHVISFSRYLPLKAPLAYDHDVTMLQECFLYVALAHTARRVLATRGPAIAIAARAIPSGQDRTPAHHAQMKVASAPPTHSVPIIPAAAKINALRRLRLSEAENSSSAIPRTFEAVMELSIIVDHSLPL